LSTKKVSSKYYASMIKSVGPDRAFCRPGFLFSKIGLGLLLNNHKFQAWVLI
jgi:hypothetical protein